MAGDAVYRELSREIQPFPLVTFWEKLLVRPDQPMPSKLKEVPAVGEGERRQTEDLTYSIQELKDT